MFNTFGLSNIKKYYLLGITSMALFQVANWVFYFSEYMSIEKVGIIDGIAILIGIGAEIPTGALADMIGKKKSMMIGYLMMSTSCFVMFFAREVGFFLIGNTLFFIGFAFISGSEEALAYDSLVEVGKEKFFSKVISTHSVLGIMSLTAAQFIGGFLYSISSGLPFFAAGISTFIGFLIAITLTEPKVDTEKFSFKGYFIQFKSGFENLLSSRLLKFTILIFALLFVAELGQGFIRQSSAKYFGFNGSNFGYLLSFTTIVATIIIFQLDNINRKLKDLGMFIFLIISFVIAYTIAYLSNNIFSGVAVFTLIAISGRVSAPFVSLVVNHNIDSKNRATTISTVSLIKQLPYILVVMLIPQIAQETNISNLFLIMIGILITGLILGLVVFSIQQKNTKKRII